MDVEAESSIDFSVLRCSLQEDDLDKKESCTWQWDDLKVERRPEERNSLFEFDSVNNEGFERKQQIVFLVQRSPLQTVRAGILGRSMRDYKLPYTCLLPVPLFVPSRLHLPEDSGSKQKMTHSDGLHADKQDITGLIHRLPKVIQPLQVSSFISPPPSLYNTNIH
ncbi:telethonin-like [Eleutherodactylus coqui]|uniref:telethonin-like n=1 Tax=Eleutherodactylus coqui TaxID=57060 RepID=UPI00346263E5